MDKSNETTTPKVEEKECKLKHKNCHCNCVFCIPFGRFVAKCPITVEAKEGGETGLVGELQDVFVYCSEQDPTPLKFTARTI